MEGPAKQPKEDIGHYQRALGPFVAASEGTRMPLAFTDTDGEHSVVFANNSFLRLTGYRRDEVIGRPFGLILTGLRASKAFDLVQAQFHDSTEELDVECWRKDGGRIWAALCVAPVFNEQGSVVQFVASLADLTEQMKRLRSERSAIQLLYQQTPDFIAITEGPEHRFTFANTAYQHLVGGRQLIGRTLSEALPELAGQEALARCDQVYRTGEPFVTAGMVINLQREEGADVETRHLDLIFQPVTDPDGTVTGIFCEGHDVTDQRALSAQVKGLQADLVHVSKLSGTGTMAATIAHEMTQPLTAISNYTAACLNLNTQEGHDREQMKVFLDAIATSARRGGEVIRQLQQLTERRKSPRDHFRLKEAIEESIALVRASGAGHASIVNRSGRSIELDADRTQIQQVLANLLRNSCEAIGSEDGCVTVSTATTKGKVIVSIKDTGRGMSDEAAKKLFQWSESTKSNGSGIGLSICRTIVEAHGGNLWLQDSGHAGSCFAFSLPFVAGSEA